MNQIYCEPFYCQFCRIWFCGRSSGQSTSALFPESSGCFTLFSTVCVEEGVMIQCRACARPVDGRSAGAGVASERLKR